MQNYNNLGVCVCVCVRLTNPEVGGDGLHLANQVRSQVLDVLQIVLHGPAEVHQVVQVNRVVRSVLVLQGELLNLSWKQDQTQNPWLHICVCVCVSKASCHQPFCSFLSTYTSSCFRLVNNFLLSTVTVQRFVSVELRRRKDHIIFCKQFVHVYELGALKISGAQPVPAAYLTIPLLVIIISIGYVSEDLFLWNTHVFETKMCRMWLGYRRSIPTKVVWPYMLYSYIYKKSSRETSCSVQNEGDSQIWQFSWKFEPFAK